MVRKNLSNRDDRAKSVPVDAGGRIAVSRRRWRVGLCAVTGSVIVATAGCSGEELFRQPVSGYVTLDGKPLALGVVNFYPVQGNDSGIMINGGAMVKDGYFSMPRSSGLIPGKYSVLISAAEPRHRRHGNREEREEHEDNETVAREVVPAKYNTETELAIEIKDNAIKELILHLDSH
jgi:hypothetical protein